MLIDYYVATHLKVRGRMNPHHILDLDNFIKVLKGRSCLLNEIKLKILSKPGKHSKKSVFFKG